MLQTVAKKEKYPATGRNTKAANYRVTANGRDTISDPLARVMPSAAAHANRMPRENATRGAMGAGIERNQAKMSPFGHAGQGVLFRTA